MESPPRERRRAITFAGGVFSKLHRQIVGPAFDLSSLDASAYSPALLERARATWAERALTEFRSIQIMSRFLSEVVGAGDPLDVYAGALEMVQDEIRHTEGCAAICRALGGVPALPLPVALQDPAPFLAAPMAERALTTAISMLAINETISTGFIEDLAARCRNPAIKAVVDATIDDEEEHREFGWQYVRQSLSRFRPSTLPSWRHLVAGTLQPHRDAADRALAGVSPGGLRLDAWDEPELAELGLFSAERQALLFRRTLTEVLEPHLRDLDLWPG